MSFTVGGSTPQLTFADATVQNTAALPLTGGSVSADITVNGLTVGRGAGAVATNTAVGASALAGNTSGASNSSLGYQALYSNTTASNNTAVGYQAGYALSAVANQTFLGYQAGYNRSTGNDNYSTVMVGNLAGYSTSTGTDNTYIGGYVARFQTGSLNTALGSGALYGVNGTSTGSNNTAVGASALISNTTASNNTAVGTSALTSNTTASNNTAVGYQALYTNTVSANTTALGYQAGYSLAGSSNNTLLGYQAGYSINGYTNTFVGYSAGSAITSGNQNTILGAYTGNSGGLDIRTAINYIVLSDGAGNPRWYCNGSGQWTVPANGVSSSSRGGNSCINLSSGAVANDANFHITDAVANNAYFGLLNGNAYVMNSTLGVNLSAGATSWASASDSRLKNVTGTYTTALSDITQINVVKFTWKSDAQNKPQVGVIAQSVQKVIPEAVDSMTLNPTDTTEYLTVRYTELIPLMIASIQELKAEFDSYKATHP